MDDIGEQTGPVGAALAVIRQRIAQACRAAGRDPAEVTLVAVSKTHGAPLVQAALACGQMHFGENRVREADSKFTPLRPHTPPFTLHLIGGLQTNKADDAVRIADVIESVDRPSLAAAILKAAGKHGRLPKLLVQVNTGDEAQKSGVALREAGAFITQCRAGFGAALTGLMCIPPVDADPAPHFRTLARLAQEHGLSVLSMGMSGDFEAAIACGATHVRVGSAIFGMRPPG
jgi:pyridoxal phosphate enzyme (YggS family)